MGRFYINSPSPCGGAGDHQDSGLPESPRSPKISLMAKRPSPSESIFLPLHRFLARIQDHDVSAVSTQAAYHALLSVFPGILLMEYMAGLFPRFRESLWLPLWRSLV